MKYAIVEDGKVVNLAVADAPLEANWIAFDDAVNIGDLWDGQTFTPGPAPQPAVPSSITPRQARLALLGAGMLATVEGAFAQLPEPQKTAASIEWEYATSIERTSPLVSQFGPMLGLTEQQIDALFIQGAAL